MGSSGPGGESGSRFSDLFRDLRELVHMLYIETVPSYGNSFWFQVGFYIMVLGALLAVTGLMHTVEGFEYHLHEYFMGMTKFNVEPWQIGSYWLAPYDALEAWGDHIPWWHTLYNATIALAFFLVVLLLPWIPGLRDLQDGRPGEEEVGQTPGGRYHTGP